MDSDVLLSTDITRIRKAQLKDILIKYNIGTTNENTDTIRKKASILKQSILLAKAEPQLQDFINGVIKHTHVLDAKQKLQFPILTELEKIVLYSQASPIAGGNEYESLDDSEDDDESLSEAIEKSGSHTKPVNDTGLSGPYLPLTHVSQVNLAMTENLPLISAGSFNGLNSENATDFIEKYLLAADSNNWSERSKLTLFPNHLGGIAINWFKIYKSKAPNNIIPDWETLKTDFLQAFTPLAQSSSLSAILEHKLQGVNETTLSYLLDITTTCRRYDPQITETQIISYILRGLRPEILQKVLTKQNDTLDKLEKNLRDAEILEIKLRQNLALYSKQTRTPNNLPNESDNNELSQLRQQVNVLTELVATILPHAPQGKNWSPRQGDSRAYNPSHQQQTRWHNKPQGKFTPQQIRLKTHNFTTQSHPRGTQPPYKTSQQYCVYCKTNTHLTEHCWFRTNTGHPEHDKPIACRYCKQQGHVIQQCTKSRFYNPNYKVDLHQPISRSVALNHRSENGPAGVSTEHGAPR